MSKIIIGNQKMYMTKDDVISFKEFINNVDKSNKQIILCPSIPFIEYYKDIIPVGAQDVSLNENGAYTGEVSAAQLKSLNVKYTIVGHSERREYHYETDEEVNEKIKILLNYDIIPILCIGEKLTEREEKLTETVIKKQLDTSLKKLSPESVEKIIIAYEPVWAIGTGLTPTTKEVDDAMLFIKKYIKENFNIEQIIVLYGGSVSEKNVDKLNNIESIDGYLIGGASVKQDSLAYIINSQK